MNLVRLDLCNVMCFRTAYPTHAASQPFLPVWSSPLYFSLATEYDIRVSLPGNNVLSHHTTSFSLLKTLLHNLHSPAQLLPPFCNDSSLPFLRAEFLVPLLILKLLFKKSIPLTPTHAFTPDTHSNQGQPSLSLFFCLLEEYRVQHSCPTNDVGRWGKL